MDTPSIRRVSPGQARTLILTWKNGSESTVDVSDHLSAYAAFAPLCHDDEAFRTVTVGEWGWNAHWSDDMEIAADTLWRLALEQGGAWLRSWREERGLTQDEAATALGISPRMLRYYEAGRHLLPKTVRLACAGLDAQDEAA